MTIKLKNQTFSKYRIQTFRKLGSEIQKSQGAGSLIVGKFYLE